MTAVEVVCLCSTICNSSVTMCCGQVGNKPHMAATASAVTAAIKLAKPVKESASWFRGLQTEHQKAVEDVKAATERCVHPYTRHDTVLVTSYLGVVSFRCRYC